MGSVTPLLALAQELRCRRPDMRFFWIGTRGGPERKLVEETGIPFRAIYSGKWRRYVSFSNIIDPLLIVLGFFQSLVLIIVHRPSVIVSAGSFVSVPLVWAGFLLRVPSVIHQQDISVGLANKLMQPFAKKITVAFEEQLKLFPAKKVVWTGNPVREEILHGDRVKATELFHLEEGIPTVLVTGGGTGAEFLNELVLASLPELTQFCQIIHLMGGNKFCHPRASPPQADEDPGIQVNSGLDSRLRGNDIEEKNRYHSYEFLASGMPHALAAADLVVSRAGMGILTELAALGKPAIVVPMPGTHQEKNAAFFARHGAIEVASQESLTPQKFIALVQGLLQDVKRQTILKDNILKLMPHHAAQRMAKEILKI